MMREIQAQLNDSKKRAEKAEQIARQAEWRMAVAEKNLGMEKEKMSKAVAEAYRRIRAEDDERSVFENERQMQIESLEQNMLNHPTDTEGNIGQQAHIWTLHHPTTRVDNSDVEDIASNLDAAVTDTRAEPIPHVGLFFSSVL